MFSQAAFAMPSSSSLPVSAVLWIFCKLQRGQARLGIGSQLKLLRVLKGMNQEGISTNIVEYLRTHNLPLNCGPHLTLLIIRLIGLAALDLSNGMNR
jgi:hypothetical protein